MSNNFKPIHRFFHGDPIEGMSNMYSTSVGDAWLYFDNNRLVGVCHLEIDPDKNGDQFYVLDEASEAAKDAMRNEMSNATVSFVDIDDLVGHALRFVSKEISMLVENRLLQNQSE